MSFLRTKGPLVSRSGFSAKEAKGCASSVSGVAIFARAHELFAVCHGAVILEKQEAASGSQTHTGAVSLAIST